MPSDQPAVGSPPVCYPARAGRVRVGAIVLTILFLVVLMVMINLVY